MAAIPCELMQFRSHAVASEAGRTGRAARGASPPMAYPLSVALSRPRTLQTTLLYCSYCSVHAAGWYR